MRIFYSLFLYLLTPLVLLRLALLGIRTPSYWTRWKERFGVLPQLNIDRPVIWLHAVSVGEVEAAAPLITKLLTHFPDYQIVVTTVTPTGAETVKRRFRETVKHFYLPYDLPVAINSFLGKIRPSVCIIMETEIWPNLYHYNHEQKIPVLLINARLSLSSLKGYKKFKGLMKQTLGYVHEVVAQTSLDAERIISIGCDPAKVSVAGNLKFDIDIPVEMQTRAGNLRQQEFSQRPVWIAASTHDKEESYILEAHNEILKVYENCLLILVPRHPHRFNQVADLCRKGNFEIVRKSEHRLCDNKSQIFLLDSLGDLQSYYACADLAFVGGSLVPAGGHNMLEPASLGLPVVSGVNVSNFHEISRLLLEAGGMLLIKDAGELARTVIQLLGDEKMRQTMGQNNSALIEKNRGGTERVFTMLRAILE